jgi:hypothetical protein
LKDAEILVDPVVTVTILEYDSRPISVLGAVELSLHFSREDPLAAHACKKIADQVEQMLSGVRLKPVGVAPAELEAYYLPEVQCGSLARGFVKGLSLAFKDVHG